MGKRVPLASKEQVAALAKDPWYQMWAKDNGYAATSYSPPAFSGLNINRPAPALTAADYEKFNSWKSSLGIPNLGGTSAPTPVAAKPVLNTPLPWDGIVNGASTSAEMPTTSPMPAVSPVRQIVPRQNMPRQVMPAPMGIPPEIAAQMQAKGIDAPGVNRMGTGSTQGNFGAQPQQHRMMGGLVGPWTNSGGAVPTPSGASAPRGDMQLPFAFNGRSGGLSAPMTNALLGGLRTTQNAIPRTKPGGK